MVRQLHITLAVGFALVACLTAFGGGVIVGMWYKAGDQPTPLSVVASAPSPDKPGLSQEAAPPPPEAQAPVTFYNTLTNHSVAYAPLTPQPVPAVPATPVVPKGTGMASSAAPVVSAAPVSPKGTTPVATEATAASPGATNPDAPSAVVPRLPTPSATPDSPKPVPAAKSAPVPAPAATEKVARSAAVARAVAPGSPQKSAKATPAPTKVVAVAPVTPTASAKTATVTAQTAPKPVPAVRQAAKEPPAKRPASAEPTRIAKAASKEDFSVQVGSFGSAEQAERLRSNLSTKGYPVRVQPSSVPGQGLRYRVRVGNYAERTAANQSAQHLTVQEQVPAIVAGKD